MKIPLHYGWVYRTKHKENGEIDHLKAKLVIKSYTQLYIRDFQETFSPFVKYDLFG